MPRVAMLLAVMKLPGVQCHKIESLEPHQTKQSCRSVSICSETEFSLDLEEWERLVVSVLAINIPLSILPKASTENTPT